MKITNSYSIEDFQPTGLCKIREDDEFTEEDENNINDEFNNKDENNLMSSLEKNSLSTNSLNTVSSSYLLNEFPTESLYSFSFASNNGDYQKLSARRNSFNRTNNYYNSILHNTYSMKNPSPLCNVVDFNDKFSHRLNSLKNIDSSLNDDNKKSMEMCNAPTQIKNNKGERKNSNNLNDNNNNKITEEIMQKSEEIINNEKNNYKKKNLLNIKKPFSINTHDLEPKEFKTFPGTPTVCSLRSPLRILGQSHATVITDNKQKILTINDIFCSITNNSKNQIIGKSIIDLLFGTPLDNTKKDTDNDNHEEKDTTENIFNQTIFETTQKYLSQQKEKIVKVIEKDLEEAKEIGININDDELPKSPISLVSSTTPETISSSNLKSNTTQNSIPKDKVLICGQVVSLKIIII